jgi:beta-lactamase superfamily II metal-dependent hydrolase
MQARQDELAPFPGRKQSLIKRARLRLKERWRVIVRGFRRLNNWLTRTTASQELTVYLFNVGQGDHILIELPNGEFGIIDFYYEKKLGWLEPPALTYLEHLRSSNPARKIVIAFICISHPDHDHIKGIEFFLGWVKRNGIKVRKFWMFAGGDFEQLVARLRAAYEQTSRDSEVLVEAKKIRNRLESIDDFLKTWSARPEYLQDIRKLGERIGGAVKVILIAPLGEHIKTYDEKAWADLFRLILEKQKHDNAERNLMSSVLMMIFHEHRLLFGGDTGEEIWQECLDHYYALEHEIDHGSCRGNFIKVSHHGARNSSSEELWRRLLTPEKTLLGISAGRNERLGHPHSETLADILKAARAINTKAEIISTNLCRDCVQSKSLTEERFDWLSADGSRPGGLKRRNSRQPENLAAYILRFHSQSADISLSRAVSSLISERPDCIYGPSARNGQFPDCAALQDSASV